MNLTFREGRYWTFVASSNSTIVAPAFGTREEAEIWQAPFLEQRAAEEAARQAAEEAARQAAEEAARAAQEAAKAQAAEHADEAA